MIHRWIASRWAAYQDAFAVEAPPPVGVLAVKLGMLVAWTPFHAVLRRRDRWLAGAFDDALWDLAEAARRDYRLQLEPSLRHEFARIRLLARIEHHDPAAAATLRMLGFSLSGNEEA